MIKYICLSFPLMLTSFLISCKDKNLPVPAHPEDTYQGADTTLWSSGAIKVYEGNFHRIDSGLIPTGNGTMDLYEFLKETNQVRQYLVKEQGDTIYFTFNKYAVYGTTAIALDRIDNDGYYTGTLESFKLAGDTLWIKSDFSYYDYLEEKMIKVKARYTGLLQP